MTSDAQLTRAARDDPDAFAELYRRHVHVVHAFLRARLPEQVAGELTAETFAQAALSIRRFHDELGGCALPWLYGIARNLLRAYYEHERVERRARERLGMPLHAYELDLDATTERLDAGRAGPAPLAALDTLPLSQQHALSSGSFASFRTRKSLTRSAAPRSRLGSGSRALSAHSHDS